MSGSDHSSGDARANALALVAEIKSRISKAKEVAASNSIPVKDLIRGYREQSLEGVGVLKTLECVPALGKVGARDLVARAEVSQMATFDELNPDQVQRLVELIAERLES